MYLISALACFLLSFSVTWIAYIRGADWQTDRWFDPKRAFLSFGAGMGCLVLFIIVISATRGDLVISESNFHVMCMILGLPAGILAYKKTKS